MDKLSKDWQEKFDTVWTGPDYRQGSPGLRLVNRFMGYAAPGCVVNDYGSGTGRAAVELIKQGFKVNMLDISLKALEKEARELITDDLTFTHASLWNIPKGFPRASWGFCVEALQTLPPNKLMAVLRNIKDTCENLFLQVANWRDTWNGIRVNQIVEDNEWWEGQLKKVWASVEQIPSFEIDKRYIFICRGENEFREIQS